MPDYGIDLAGVLDIDPNLTTVTGGLAVAHNIARGLTTPRGALFYAPEWGYDLRLLLNDTGVPASAVASHVEAQCMRDERVLSAEAAVTFIGEVLTVAIQFVTAEGPFELTLEVSALRVETFVRRL